MDRKKPPTPTRRPTVFVPSITTHRIQEVVLGTFMRYGHTPIDLEALVYFVLQHFDVNPISYEDMYKLVRKHILSNFAVHQGDHIRLSEVSMRRLTVVYTIE